MAAPIPGAWNVANRRKKMAVDIGKIAHEILQWHDINLNRLLRVNGIDKIGIIITEGNGALHARIIQEMVALANAVAQETKDALPSKVFGIDLTDPAAEVMIEHYLRNKIMLELNPPKEVKSSKEMTDEEFDAKISKLNAFKTDGTRNQNVVKALTARGRDVETFYASLKV
jgi:hypothetical protein